MRRIERVAYLKGLCKKRASLEEMIWMASKPIRYNRELLDYLFGLCTPVVDLSRKERVNARRVSLFAVLAFVCPSALVGGRLPKGLRHQIWSVLYGEKNPSVVSTDVSYVTFCYDHYRDFREEVDKAINMLEAHLSGRVEK